MLPDCIRDALASILPSAYRLTPIRGGGHAQAAKLSGPDGTFLLKWAEGEAGRSFAAEALGLDTLRSVAGEDLLVPTVLAKATGGDHPGFLLLPWIERGRFDRKTWTRFGTALADLHRTAPRLDPEGNRYGCAFDNWIGATPQRNGWHDDWPTFFADARLHPQFERARRAGRWRPSWDDPAHRLLARLPDLLPARPPLSLLHGDLWAGNVLPTPDGLAALIDPAVYVGDRETDLAMTELFGRFDASFYEGYRAAWPLETGYEERRAIYNLYHLVNHLNLFGAGYAPQVERTLRHYA